MPSTGQCAQTMFTFALLSFGAVMLAYVYIDDPYYNRCVQKHETEFKTQCGISKRYIKVEDPECYCGPFPVYPCRPVEKCFKVIYPLNNITIKDNKNINEYTYLDSCFSNKPYPETKVICYWDGVNIPTLNHRCNHPLIVWMFIPTTILFISGLLQCVSAGIITF